MHADAIKFQDGHVIGRVVDDVGVNHPHDTPRDPGLLPERTVEYLVTSREYDTRVTAPFSYVAKLCGQVLWPCCSTAYVHWPDLRSIWLQHESKTP